MNTQTITFFAIAFVTFIGFIIFRLRINFAKFKGQRGEKSVSKTLMQLPDEYIIFNNVYIKENGRYSQIDHIVLSPYGIFVIETKKYNGWIYGGEKAPYWTQNIYGTKYEFYNPLRQNYGHVKQLQSLFGYPVQFFIPIVVFVGNATIKGNYHKHIVIYKEELLSTIRQYKNVIFRNDILKEAVNKLSYSSFKTSETASEHIKQVKNEIKERNTTIQQGICPRCGGVLVYRESKYGRFYGCSNYPKCRYTLNES